MCQRHPYCLQQPPPGHVSAKTVCREVGVSYRELDWWCTHNLFGRRFQGDGSGIPRLFGPRDVIKVAAAKRMREIGIDLVRIRDALQQDQELVLVADPLPEPDDYADEHTWGGVA